MKAQKWNIYFNQIVLKLCKKKIEVDNYQFINLIVLSIRIISQNFYYWLLSFPLGLEFNL